MVFNEIFVAYNEKCFNELLKLTDHPVLTRFLNDELPTKDRTELNCDDLFLTYLYEVKEKSNKAYFILILKFVLLFRECLNTSRQIRENPNINSKKLEYSSMSNAETLPDLCNEFVTEYLDSNNYFGIESEKDRSEIIELIQHFCNWLFVNKHTLCRLSRIS